MQRALSLLLLFAPLLAAQDKSIDIAVAYPSTTMLYGVMDNTRLTQDLELDGLLRSLNAENGMLSLEQLLTDRLELKLTREEISALGANVKRSSGAILDITVSGPKLLFVFEHADLAAVSRALKQALEANVSTVPEVKDHYGAQVYAISYTPAAKDINPGMDFRINPVPNWFQNQDFWVTVYENRYLVVSNNYSAVTDAIDFLAFPDDTTDTLLSSARYRDAVNEYKDPDALIYLSIESVITAVERLGGDKGNNIPLWQILPLWRFGIDGGEGEFGFISRLMQYEQFKSAAAAMWIDESKSTLRIDAGLSFHNAPGWFEALRIEPQKRPFADMIPSDATLAVTDCIRDPMALYKRFKDFVCTRARNAGQKEIADKWDEWEKRLIDDGSDVDELLSHLSGEQAMIVLPRITMGNPWEVIQPSVAMLLSVKDAKAGEQYLHEKFLPSKLGEPLRQAEGGITPIVMHAGLEIHCAGAAETDVAFALMAREDGSAVLIVGTLDAVKRVADARAGRGGVASLASWQTADKLLPEKSSLGMYMNGGALIKFVGGAIFSYSRWMDEEEVDDLFNRDDTDKDDDPVPFLSEIFKDTVIVGGAQSEEDGVRFRMVAAGWPSREHMRGMVRHFRDVRRNVEVRDDLLALREASFAHYAIKGKPPTELNELVKLGYAREESVTLDPFGEQEPRPYLLAPVPETVDSRQAILMAYQSKPGLRGNHLAVLWNSHVVELKPDELVEAIERAKKGEALLEDRYKIAEEALFKQDLEVKTYEEVAWEPEGIEVAIIDDEGNEETIEAQAGSVRETTEHVLDQKETEKKE